LKISSTVSRFFSRTAIDSWRFGSGVDFARSEKDHSRALAIFEFFYTAWNAGHPVNTAVAVLFDRFAPRNSRVISDACIPFRRKKTFPVIARSSKALDDRIRAKGAKDLPKGF
jgi:hypothetical protein